MRQTASVRDYAPYEPWGHPSGPGRRTFGGTRKDQNYGPHEDSQLGHLELGSVRNLRIDQPAVPCVDGPG
jgi:hypothetical protein